MGKAAKKENKGVKSKHNIAKQQKKAAKKSGAGGPGPEPPSSPARQPPSRASGGVPDPTPAYLDQALGKPRALPRPRRLLVVLDLNGTMLHRPSKRRPFHFVERPHAQRFLAYCLDNFHLAIWSSARPANVARMVEKLLTPEQVRRCLLVWARDRFRLSPQDYDARVQVYKRLTRVWDDPAVRASASAPSAARWDQSNTVLVDDSREKGRSEPYNILPLPEFSGLENETAEVLPQVHDYLNALCWQADVSRYIRETPFQLDPNYRLSNQ